MLLLSIDWWGWGAQERGLRGGGRRGVEQGLSLTPEIYICAAQLIVQSQ